MEAYVDICVSIEIRIHVSSTHLDGWWALQTDTMLRQRYRYVRLGMRAVQGSRDTYRVGLSVLSRAQQLGKQVIEM